MTMTETPLALTGLSVADTGHPIETHAQLGGQGTVYNKALAIPVHLGLPWNSLEYVLLPPAAEGIAASVGEHVQGTDEIYFIHRGQGILTTNGDAQQVGPGFLAIAPRGTRHSICNPSPHEALSFLVIELRAPADAARYEPTSVASLFSLMQETTTFRTARLAAQEIPLRVATVDLARSFAAPWGQLALFELPSGSRIAAYSLPDDENLFVVAGNATIEVAGQRFLSFEHDLNALVPRGLPRSIANRSSRDPLVILSLCVQRAEGAKE